MKNGTRPNSVIYLLLFLAFACFDSCRGSLPEDSARPDEQASWQDVLASDSNYPHNVYLTKTVSSKSGIVGEKRRELDYYDAEGRPKTETFDGACGPPEGSVAQMSNADADMAVLGYGGEAVWQFDPSWAVIDEAGPDFITFSNHNLMGSRPDTSWNELADVFVSEDGVVWYGLPPEEKDGVLYDGTSFSENPDPSFRNVNGDYIHEKAKGYHGINHCWANFRKEVQAEELSADGVYIAVSGKYVSKYFGPETEGIGGDRFDLKDFRKIDGGTGETSGVAWPEGGRMRYLKLRDASEVLDGQDSFAGGPDWMTGARLMSAMGINVVKEE